MGREYNKVKQTSFVVVISACAAVVAAFFLVGHRAGAACTAPSNSLGKVTGSFNIPAAGTYTVWTRMKAPDTQNNSVVMDIDGTSCGNVIGDNINTTNTWTWVNYRSGSTSNVFTTQLSAGPHSYTLHWTENAVQVERVIFASDPACIPTGNGDNCVPVSTTNPPTTTTPPTVTLTSPSNGATVSGASVILTATATSSSTIARVEFLVDGNIVATDTTSPYSATWDSTAVVNGTHTVAAKVYDSAQSATSQSASITVTNSAAASSSFEGESMTLPSNAGRVQSDAAASGGQMLFNWGLTGAVASSTKAVTTPSANRITIRARGDQCNGAPQMIVKIDGTQVLQQDVTATSYTDYTANITLAAGNHTIEISFTNDEYNTCDRNLIIDKVTFTTVTVTTPTTGSQRCDFNGDNTINSRDLAIFIGGFSRRDIAYDLNKDGRVTAQDLAIMLGRCK